MDWDGTLREGYTILDWVLFLEEKGAIEKQHRNKMLKLKDDFLLHKLKYNQVVWESARIYAEAIKGCNRLSIETLAADFALQDQNNLKSFVVPLFETLNKKYFTTIILTGAPFFPMEEYRKILGVSQVYCTEVRENLDSVYTAQVKSFWGSKSKKRKFVQELINQNASIFLALGDSEADLPMIRNAQYGVFIGEQFAKITKSITKTIELVNSNELAHRIEEIIQETKVSNSTE